MPQTICSSLLSFHGSSFYVLIFGLCLKLGYYQGKRTYRTGFYVLRIGRRLKRAKKNQALEDTQQFLCPENRTTPQTRVGEAPRELETRFLCPENRTTPQTAATQKPLEKESPVSMS